MFRKYVRILFLLASVIISNYTRRGEKPILGKSGYRVCFQNWVMLSVISNGILLNFNNVKFSSATLMCWKVKIQPWPLRSKSRCYYLSLEFPLFVIIYISCFDGSEVCWLTKKSGLRCLWNHRARGGWDQGFGSVSLWILSRECVNYHEFKAELKRAGTPASPFAHWIVLAQTFALLGCDTGEEMDPVTVWSKGSDLG